MQSLAEKRVVVTGGAQGLGLAIVSRLSESGANVVIIDNDQQALAGVSLPNVKGIVCDISDPVATRELASDLASEQIDVLINNAAIWTDNDLEQTEVGRRQRAFLTNVAGHIELTEALLPALQQQDKAHIFNVISTGGDMLSPSGDNRLWRTYGATKTAMLGYTKALRDALLGSRIKVSGFFPGGFDSNFYEKAGRDNAHDQPWMMRVDDVADGVMFALTRPDDVLVESMTLVKFGHL